MRTRAQARAEARAEAAAAIAECVERHDLLTHIFLHVGEHQGGDALTRCEAVCRGWLECSKDPMLEPTWRQLCLRMSPAAPIVADDDDDDDDSYVCTAFTNPSVEVRMCASVEPRGPRGPPRYADRACHLIVRVPRSRVHCDHRACWPHAPTWATSCLSGCSSSVACARLPLPMPRAERSARQPTHVGCSG